MANYSTVTKGSWCVSKTTGTTIPQNMVKLSIFNGDNHKRGMGDGALMMADQADQFCLTNGYLQYFRDTSSFIDLLKHYAMFYGVNHVANACANEGLDFFAVMNKVYK